jgi:hypothetical protein
MTNTQNRIIEHHEWHQDGPAWVAQDVRIEPVYQVWQGDTLRGEHSTWSAAYALLPSEHDGPSYDTGGGDQSYLTADGWYYIRRRYRAMIAGGDTGMRHRSSLEAIWAYGPKDDVARPFLPGTDADRVWTGSDGRRIA